MFGDGIKQIGERGGMKVEIDSHIETVVASIALNCSGDVEIHKARRHGGLFDRKMPVSPVAFHTGGKAQRQARTVRFSVDKHACRRDTHFQIDIGQRSSKVELQPLRRHKSRLPMIVVNNITIGNMYVFDGDFGHRPTGSCRIDRFGQNIPVCSAGRIDAGINNRLLEPCMTHNQPVAAIKRHGIERGYKIAERKQRVVDLHGETVGRAGNDPAIAQTNAEIGEGAEKGELHRLAFEFGVQIIVGIFQHDRGNAFGRKNHISCHARRQRQKRRQPQQRIQRPPYDFAHNSALFTDVCISHEP